MESEKMSLQSMDLAEKNREQLKQLFPSVFVESVDERGNLAESIDFDKLKAELGTFSELFEGRRERYGLDWPGKTEALKIIQKPSIATLKPDRVESVNFDSTENLFIEGDNLEVLKLLQKSYYGKIKMIYIDPPYNTGKEFIYPDNYTETLETYLAYAGLTDDHGRKFSTNTQNEGRYHTKWLNMMYPRLYLARNLLTEDGVIFISIDDSEVTGLRGLCDDVFGEENFIASVVWQRAYAPVNLNKHFSVNHDYILIYARHKENFELTKLPRTKKQNADYQNRDGDPRGPWKAGNPSVGPAIQENIYEISLPSGRVVLPPAGRSWLYSKKRFQELVEDNRIYFGRDGNGVWAPKLFLSEVSQGVTPLTLWPYTEVGHSQDATKELKELFDQNSYFDYPKPVMLLKRIIHLGTDPTDGGGDIVLDFFAGSATTAHAVLDLNKEDGGNRKFIMVQLPEPCGEGSDAHKAGYGTIADIGKERIRRAISKINAEQEETRTKAANAIPGLGEEVPELDLGFKVLKLDQSNFKIWDGSDPNISEEDLQKQLELHIDHIDPNSSEEDILYELLLKAGFMPTVAIEQREMAGKRVYSVDAGTLLICLEDEVTKKLITELAKAAPRQVICLDQGFNRNDQLKANAVQAFSAHNEGRDKAEQIVFRTV